MERSLRSMFLAAGVLCIAWSSALTAADAVSPPEKEPLLQVHLPREVTVRDNRLDLGQISVIRGLGPVVAQVRKIGMGRLSIPGQKIVLDRTTILSRLASSGISADQVRLTGAQAVTVRRQQRTIEAEDFLSIGKEFLKKHPSASQACETQSLVQPKDYVLSQQVKDIQFVPRFAAPRARGLISIEIDVMADGAKVATRDMTFRMKYRGHQVVTTEPIAEGTVLTAQNVKIEETLLDSPESEGWRPPYGLAATHSLPANMILRQGMVEIPKPPVVVQRNETVVIRIERPGLLITATGMALQQARTGEFVKVRNTDSHRVIVCKVIGAGTVEPVL